MTSTRVRVLTVYLLLGYLTAWVAMAQVDRRYTESRVLPVDEAPQDEEFFRFRQRLSAVLDSGNLEAITPMFSEDVRATGRTSLSAADAAELRSVLRLGGSFTTTRGAQPGRREFCAPYAYSEYPPTHTVPEDLLNVVEDGFVWVVLGTGVRVRGRPSIVAPIVGTLHYDLVPVQDLDANDESGASYVWQLVLLSDGRIGYVESSLLFGDRNKHVCFANIGGQWRIAEFETRFDLSY